MTRVYNADQWMFGFRQPSEPMKFAGCFYSVWFYVCHISLFLMIVSWMIEEMTVVEIVKQTRMRWLPVK